MHRIATVQYQEQKLAGHIYAVQFVSGLNGHYNALCKALKYELELEIVDCEHIGEEPDPSWVKHAEDIMKHTVWSEELNVRSRANTNVKRERAEWRSIGQDRINASQRRPTKRSDKMEPGRTFLKFYNRDPRAPRGAHLCRGCCSNVEERRRNTFAAILGLGLLMNSMTQASTARWGSTSGGMRVAAAGIMFNRIIPRTFKRAFPNWAGMDAGQQGAVDDVHDDDYHLGVRKKVYRTIKYYEDAELCEITIIVAFTSAPLDHLWRSLMMVDETQYMLQECLSEGTSLFHMAIKEYQAMLVDGDDGPLGVVAHHFQDRKHEMIKRMRNHVFVLQVLIWWRFVLLYEDWPFLIAGLAREGMSWDYYSKVCDGLYKAKCCCVDEAFGMKARKLFAGAAIMAADAEFRNLIRDWCRVCRVSNMHVERLLGEILRASRDHASGERLSAAGGLAQWLKKHIDAGGSDPRSSYRRDALRQEVPIRAAKKEKNAKYVPGERSGALMYVNEKYKEMAHRR